MCYLGSDKARRVTFPRKSNNPRPPSLLYTFVYLLSCMNREVTSLPFVTAASYIRASCSM